MLAIALAGCAGGASEPGDVLLDGDVIDTTEPSSPVETGVHDGSIVKWNLEAEDRGPVYDFDIAVASSETRDVEIDAETGDILDR